MLKKFCPGCKEYSYSAKEEGRWVCPTCQLNLSLLPALQLNESDYSAEIQHVYE